MPVATLQYYGYIYATPYQLKPSPPAGRCTRNRQLFTPRTAMDATTLSTLLTPDALLRLFPRERANEFFDALFGDPAEGAYDIELGYRGLQGDELMMELRLHERPGRCLACNLTQGLPQVFARHPIINLNRLVEGIGELLQGQARCTGWSLGSTEQQTRSLHVVPLKIKLERV